MAAALYGCYWLVARDEKRLAAREREEADENEDREYRTKTTRFAVARPVAMRTTGHGRSVITA